MKRLALIAVALAVLSAGAWYLYFPSTPEPEPVVEKPAVQMRVLGRSGQSRPIEAHTFGTGDTHIAFIGGVHGGYEWNSTLLAYEMIDHLSANPAFVPEGMKITVIPNANPDGLYEVVGKEGRFAISDVPADEKETEEGRFNAKGVDLNRNFDCKWEAKGTWRSRTVSAGSEPFSEPEARVIRDFALNERPDAVVFWHSQADTVYASECEDGILPETLAIMHAYADAAGYKKVESFDAYEVHGDAEGWLASIGIPAITVELKTHKDIEWEKNLAGVTALVRHYSSAVAK